MDTSWESGSKRSARPEQWRLRDEGVLAARWRGGAPGCPEGNPTIPGAGNTAADRLAARAVSGSAGRHLRDAWLRGHKGLFDLGPAFRPAFQSPLTGPDVGGAAEPIENALENTHQAREVNGANSFE